MKPGLICLIALPFSCLLAGCTGGQKEKLILAPYSFSEIKEWKSDQPIQALNAFARSCKKFKWKKPNYKYSLLEAGRVKDWQIICKKLPKRKARTNSVARTFFENNFIPYEVIQSDPGLFTGYYEAQMAGSLYNEGPYQFPLWGKPEDLIKIKLGDFNREWKGKRLTGRLIKNRLVPYDDRAKIAKGSLWGRAKPIMWVEDPIDGFFMEIQGSGQIKLPNGHTVRLGYAAQNGHKYVPIGRVLKARKEIESPVSMAKIRTWLDDHPWQEQSMMNENPSAVFFTKVKEGPIGAQNAVLTPMRSLAVDPKYIPLGFPLWLETENHSRLVVAQDTGGAIKGAVRGDLFWGAGEKAENGAGQMQEKGRYYLLLPKEISK